MPNPWEKYAAATPTATPPPPSGPWANYGATSSPAAPQGPSAQDQKYQQWKQARQEFEALPWYEQLKRMVVSPNSVPDPTQPAHTPGFTEGAPLLEAGAHWTDTGPIDIGRGVKEIAKGNVAKGGHRAISGAITTAAPMTPFVAVGAPATFLRAVGGGILGSMVGEGGAEIAGANPDQQALAGDIGNLTGGFIAGSGLPRALLETPLKELAAKHGGTLLKLLEPRKAAINYLKSIVDDPEIHPQTHPQTMQSILDAVKALKDLPPQPKAAASGKMSDQEIAAELTKAIDALRQAAAQGKPDTPPSMEGYYGKTPTKSNLAANQRQLKSPTGSTTPVPAPSPKAAPFSLGSMKNYYLSEMK